KRTICRTCAEARGLLDEPSKAVAVLQNLIAQASAKPAAPKEPPVSEPEVLCSECGLSLAAFRRNGRLGRAACWTAFEAQLVPIVAAIQPQVRHVGKAPRTHARQAELRRRGDDLRAELERAVRGEDYERAAALRDEIRAVERAQSEAGETETGGGGI